MNDIGVKLGMADDVLNYFVKAFKTIDGTSFYLDERNYEKDVGLRKEVVRVLEINAKNVIFN